MAKTAFCRINENNEYVAHTDKFEEGLFIAPIPVLKQNSKAIWTGRSWKIVKGNINYSSEDIVSSIAETDQLLYVTGEQQVELSSYDNADNNFFLDKFTTEKQLLDVEIIKLIENNQKVPTEWSDYSNKLNSYIQYLDNHLVFTEECEEFKYTEDVIKSTNDFKETNFNSIGQFLKRIVVWDSEKAQELLCLNSNDINLMSKYKDDYITQNIIDTESVIVYNIKDHRIVNLDVDQRLIEKNIEDGVFRSITIRHIPPITDKELSHDELVNHLDIITNGEIDDLSDEIVFKDTFYYDAYPEFYERLDLYKLCIQYYEYYEEKYKEIVISSPAEPVEDEENVPESINEDEARALRNSQLKNRFFEECFVRFDFQKDDYQKDLERYQRLTGKTTFQFTTNGIEYDLSKLLSNEILLINLIPTYILALVEDEINQPTNYRIETDYSRVFEGYQDISDLIENVRLEQIIDNIEELEKEQAKIPEGIQPHMLKGPATLYDFDLE